MNGTGRPPERLLTIAEAAALTSYEENVIHKWITRGLRCVSASGAMKRPRHKDLRIRESVLWEWVRGLETARERPARGAPAKTARRAARAGSADLAAWRRGS